MPIACNREDDCGLVSVYRVWRDGSFSRVVEACSHEKVIPRGQAVVDEWIKQNKRKEVTV
jgi:hypothetical protein